MKQLNLKEEFKIDLCHIGGYECLRDGTRIEKCKKLNDFFEKFFDFCYDGDYEQILNYLAEQENLNDNILFEELEKIWKNRWDDGGGSGWFEIKKNTLNKDTFVLEFRKFLKQWIIDYIQKIQNKDIQMSKQKSIKFSHYEKEFSKKRAIETYPYKGYRIYSYIEDLGLKTKYTFWYSNVDSDYASSIETLEEAQNIIDHAL